jgi:hypothetical protein
MVFLQGERSSSRTIELEISKLDMIPYETRNGTRICSQKVIICKHAANAPRAKGVLTSFVKQKKIRESRDGWTGPPGRSGPRHTAGGRQYDEHYLQRHRRVSALLGRLLCGALVSWNKGQFEARVDGNLTRLGSSSGLLSGGGCGRSSSRGVGLGGLDDLGAVDSGRGGGSGSSSCRCRSSGGISRGSRGRCGLSGWVVELIS